MRLLDKVAVITGAASGVGRATSLLFASEGATVVCVDIDDALGEETAALVAKRGGKATYVHADMGDEHAVQRMAAACIARHPSIHVLFNNAGVLIRDAFGAIRLEDWNRMLAVNLTGPYLCSTALLPALQAAGGASIIHHGSVDGTFGNPYAASYSVAKGGLVPLTHVMAHTLAPHRIRVNCISSAGLYTSRQGIPVRLAPELRSGAPHGIPSRIGVTPLARPGFVEECAAAALFLASEDSSYMTGSVLTVDGGRTSITPGTGAPPAHWAQG